MDVMMLSGPLAVAPLWLDAAADESTMAPPTDTFSKKACSARAPCSLETPPLVPLALAVLPVASVCVPYFRPGAADRLRVALAANHVTPNSAHARG